MIRSVPAYCMVAAICLLLFYNLAFSQPWGEPSVLENNSEPPNSVSEEKPYQQHPAIPTNQPIEPVTSLPIPNSDHSTIAQKEIPQLISQAKDIFEDILSRQTQTVEDAAKAYRQRRGRHPPPGFDKWFAYAKENDAIIVEDFWDQIYHDLEPFFALPAAHVRAKARVIRMNAIITNGKAEVDTDWFWHKIWVQMINEVAFMLPDMRIPLNPMDEPRVMVPWETINSYISNAQLRRKIVDVQDVKENFTGWSGLGNEATNKPFEAKWYEGAPYSLARAACAPDSPIRSKTDPTSIGDDSSKIFVENSTTAADLCQDAEIASYHAALIYPLTGSTTPDLMPMFGGSKFSVNNEILLPAAMYWEGNEMFDAQDNFPWSDKISGTIWRGTASGGRNNAVNWQHFHRHRFVALNNGSKYEQFTADQNSGISTSQILTPSHVSKSLSPLPASLRSKLAQWLTTTNDVKFTDLSCDYVTTLAQCWYTDPEFSIGSMLSMSDEYAWKYLPDVDGNSFSGRYRSFLASGSLPIKATLYKEWHDSRLIAWKHFVPMNNRFTDYWAILSWFIGCDETVCGVNSVVKGHDREAEEIAKAGREWAGKVLRKVDMQVYVARLLLEYARVTDDDRDVLGWVGDLR